MPTLAELTGSNIKGTDGKSLLPELLGKSTSQKRHEFLYFEYPENGGQLAVRIGNVHLVRDLSLDFLKTDSGQKLRPANQ